jgi:hypothetical protein
MQDFPSVPSADPAVHVPASAVPASALPTSAMRVPAAPAAAAAALAALLAELVTGQAAARVRIRARRLARVMGLPGQVAGDTVIVFAALWRRLAHGAEPPSGFRVLPVPYGDDTAEGKIRRALLVGGESIAPNTFVLGIDQATDTMVIHQLVVDEGKAAG